MTPTLTAMNEQALQPYLNGKMSQQVALERAAKPLQAFMLKQTYQKDVALFVEMAKVDPPATPEDVPFYVLLPAFIISELKTAFQLGFVVFLPFLVIDLVVSSLLVSMGMMFLPPVTISLPFKIILFVLVDGWHLLSQALVTGFTG
jgi:flagellar biosynthetic protein FliP